MNINKFQIYIKKINENNSLNRFFLKILKLI